MKQKILFLSIVLIVCVTSVFAQSSGAVENPETGINLTTFVGITALVSLLGTQLAKLVPYIGEHTWCKILCSVGIGILASMLSWSLQLADFMMNFEWWQVLLTGVASGLSACGFYDLVKVVVALFKKNCLILLFSMSFLDL